MRALLCVKPFLHQALVARPDCYYRRITQVVPELTVRTRLVELPSMDQRRLGSSTSQICQASRDRQSILAGARNSHDVTSASTAESSLRSTMSLCGKDKSLITLFLAASSHQWQLLPDLGRACYEHDCSVAQVRGCLRHVVIVAGYAPALSATKHLAKAQLLPEETPGKCGGPPGNAFELAYAKVTDAVRRAVHTADPVLADWIRTHLYGDIYSSPGLEMRQKQLLMCAFLGRANMPDELFGHAVAALRFGASPAACNQAVNLGFEWSKQRLSSVAQEDSQSIQQHALECMQKAIDKHASKHGREDLQYYDVTVPDPETICSPPLPPRYNTSQHS